MLVVVIRHMVENNNNEKKYIKYQKEPKTIGLRTRKDTVLYTVGL